MSALGEPLPFQLSIDPRTIRRRRIRIPCASDRGHKRFFLGLRSDPDTSRSESAAKAGPLLHDQLSVQRAGGFDRLQNVDHFARTDAERIEAGDKIRERHIITQQRDVPGRLVDGDLGARQHDRLAGR